MKPSPSVAPAISVVIVNWNSKDYVRSCLQSLARYRPSFAVEIIVVDGGSFDGCGEMLAREFPAVIFVQSPDNIGFARCNNLGALYAKGDTLLLLNPDTELIEDSLSRLYERLAALPDVGALGCRLLNPDRTLQMTSVQSYPTVLNQLLDSEFLRTLFPRSSLWGMQPLHAASSEPVVAEVISGACILVKRERFAAVGGFSESYFMYGEDLDLCFKLQRAGWKNYYFPGTQIVHFGGGSTRQAVGNFSTVMMRISVHRFISAHRGHFSATLYRFTTAVTAVVRLLLMGPLLLLGKRVVRHGAGSLHKWAAILRWSLGLPAKSAVKSK